MENSSGEKEKLLDEVNSAVKSCKRCALSRSRKLAVPGDGSNNAKIMLVGEAPGAQEDQEGHPFVGAAGRFLTGMLESIGIRREDVFITNVIKCRPPNNRDPLGAEIETCLPYLRRQVLLIKPRIICTLGNHSLRTLIGKDNFVSKVHGQIFRKNNYLFFAMYHPAAALYKQELKETLKEDFKKLERYLEQYELFLHPEQC